ncbi:MAG: glycine cleavage system protein H [Deltaproteobacteria bacterium]|jgi:glycine cleavage system H lipoate-binding protein|nr:glycine cleavage system protein H [Deltaproteobacteria bacterium]
MKKKIFKEKGRERQSVHGFNVLEDECIWMKAGVVNFRQCDNNFDCGSCPFDKGMRRAMGIGKNLETEQAAPKWVEFLQKKYYGASRPCRHALTGRIDAPKICAMNYECYHCSFDQMLDEMDVVRDLESPRYISASGYQMADGYYYHMGHSWSRFEHGGRIRVGVDDFLVKVFGSASSLNLPPLGEKMQQNAVGWAFARNGHGAAVLSPVTGTVLAVNQGVEEHPEMIHEDPYNTGWLLIVEPVMPKRNLKGLYFGRESVRWMEKESQRLLSLMGPEYRDLAATGAEAISDVFGSFPEIGWDVLVKTFLRTETRFSISGKI